jgi:hypothetical protein
MIRKMKRWMTMRKMRKMNKWMMMKEYKEGKDYKV